MRASGAAIGLALLAAALAGCSAKALPAALAPTLPITAEAPLHDADTCAVYGSAVDDEEQPVAGAHLGLLGPTLLTTQSAKDGRFTFSYVPPGAYSLVGTRFGYERATTPVLCQPDTLAEPVLRLLPLPTPGIPHHVILQPMSGYIGCAVGASGGGGSLSNELCRSVDSASKSKFQIKLENATTTALVLELVWTSTSSSGGKYLSVIHPPSVHKQVNYTANDNYYAGGRSASGPSPIEFKMESSNLTKSIFAKKKNTTVDAEVKAYASRLQDLVANGTNDHSSQLVYQQRFTLYAAVFYEGMTVPDGFRIRPD